MSANLRLVNEQPEPAPTSFGVWVVETVLGEGTMGCVYRARHQTLGRRVAIKRLHPALLNDKALVHRFLQEARLVNAINHPHIVEVHDFVEEPRQVYAVMELLEGETLSTSLETRALPLDEVLRIATQLAEALEAAHALSVVHRDLKPDNVFLTQRDGQQWVKVLDFGVAKLLSQEGPRVVETQNGDVLGTPRYMAPEQAAGLEVDARTDLYAFGTLVFELLAGKPPFESTVYGQLAADIITRPPPPVPTFTRTGETVPESLRSLVADCLAKLPEDRPHSMTEVLRRLRDPSAGRRRPWLIIAAGVAAAALVAAGVLVATSPRPAEAPLPAAPPVVAVLPPPAPPPVVEPPAPPAEVQLTIDSVPQGAAVLDAAGAVLGKTPVTLTRAKGTAPMPVTLRAPGYEPVTRELSSAENLHLEIPLKRLAVPPAKKESRPVTDGVIDPF